MSVGLTSVHVAPEVQSNGAHTQWARAAPLEVQRDGSVAQWNPGSKEQVLGASGRMTRPVGHWPASSGTNRAPPIVSSSTHTLPPAQVAQTPASPSPPVVWLASAVLESPPSAAESWAVESAASESRLPASVPPELVPELLPELLFEPEEPEPLLEGPAPELLLPVIEPVSPPPSAGGSSLVEEHAATTKTHPTKLDAAREIMPSAVQATCLRQFPGKRPDRTSMPCQDVPTSAPAIRLAPSRAPDRSASRHSCFSTEATSFRASSQAARERNQIWRLGVSASRGRSVPRRNE